MLFAQAGGSRILQIWTLVNSRLTSYCVFALNTQYKAIVDMENLGFYIERLIFRWHTFVGPSYVNHLMNGEGVVQVKPETFQWKMIDFI